MYYVSRIAGSLAVAVLLAAAIFSVQRARADFEFRRQSAEAVSRACEQEPGNTEYLEFRALQIDYDGGDPAPLLERAAMLNPMSSAPRIRLGLAAELRGDFASAEKWLLEASRVDRQFEPRWTLANFYFRRENGERFWTWIRAALEISYGDRRPAFDLCWRVTDRAGEIFSRAIPERREVLAAYLAWLLDTHRTDAAAPVARKLAADPENRPVVLAADDALLDAGDAASAIELWRGMGFAPAAVYRGNFEPPAIGHGFDWCMVEVAGVTHAAIDQPRTMHRIGFSGRQPEFCELLRQPVVLKRGAHYRLSWNAELSQMPSPSGLEWRIGDNRAAVGGGPEQREFIAPSDLAMLKLIYQRPSGKVRAEGAAEVWGVELRPFEGR